MMRIINPVARRHQPRTRRGACRGALGTTTINLLLIVVAVLMISGQFRLSNPASADEVRALVDKAKVSTVASAQVASVLSANPTPTVADLRDLDKRVEQALVKDVVAKAAAVAASAASGVASK